MAASVIERVKSVLSVTLLPGICLGLFFLVGDQIDQIINDADVQQAIHQQDPSRQAHAAAVKSATPRDQEAAGIDIESLPESHPN
jgi:hypothetical protein